MKFSTRNEMKLKKYGKFVGNKSKEHIIVKEIFIVINIISLNTKILKTHRNMVF